MKKIHMFIVVICSVCSCLNYQAALAQFVSPSYEDDPQTSGALLTDADPLAVKSSLKECLPEGTTLNDYWAAQWAAYAKCMKDGPCDMSAPDGPKNSRKLEPGNTKYDSYASCLRRSGMLPPPYIYEK